jgi:hypothetical protein
MLKRIAIRRHADLSDFFGPFRHWKTASGCAALPHDFLNAAGVG